MMAIPILSAFINKTYIVRESILMDTLCPDLIRTILSFLAGKDYVSMLLVCRNIYASSTQLQGIQKRIEHFDSLIVEFPSRHCISRLDLQTCRQWTAPCLLNIMGSHANYALEELAKNREVRVIEPLTGENPRLIVSATQCSRPQTDQYWKALCYKTKLYMNVYGNIAQYASTKVILTSDYLRSYLVRHQHEPKMLVSIGRFGCLQEYFYLPVK